MDLTPANSARQLIGKNLCTAKVDSAGQGDNTSLHGRMDALDGISAESFLNVRLNVFVVLPERGLRDKKHVNDKKRTQSHLDCLYKVGRNEGDEVARIRLRRGDARLKLWGTGRAASK